MADEYSEQALVEQPAIELFGELGWETADCFHEFDSGRSPLGRRRRAEVVLIPRLRAALEKLNPGLAAEAIGLAIEELTRDRSVMSMTAANREVYRLLKDGVKVTYSQRRRGDGEKTEVVRIIDWKEPWNNDFFLASQFGYRRDVQAAGRPGGVCQRLAAGVHRVEGGAQAAGERLQQEPARLQGHYPALVLVQRLHHPVQRQREPDRQHYGRVGALRRVEEDRQRG